MHTHPFDTYTTNSILNDATHLSNTLTTQQRNTPDHQNLKNLIQQTQHHPSNAPALLETLKLLFMPGGTFCLNGKTLLYEEPNLSRAPFHGTIIRTTLIRGIQLWFETTRNDLPEHHTTNLRPDNLLHVTLPTPKHLHPQRKVHVATNPPENPPKNQPENQLPRKTIQQILLESQQNDTPHHIYDTCQTHLATIKGGFIIDLPPIWRNP